MHEHSGAGRTERVQSGLSSSTEVARIFRLHLGLSKLDAHEFSASAHDGIFSRRAAPGRIPLPGF